MKNKLIVGAVALGLGLASFGAGVDAKGKPDNPGAGGKCAKAGTTFLRNSDLLVTFAQDRPLGLNLGQVVKLHTQDPSLFQGGDDSIGDWC